MKATDILMQEHRVIERVILALSKMGQRLEQGHPVRPGFFIEATDFIKNFADGCHHKKEEGVLFEALMAHGMPKQAGPIAVMMAEHEQGRLYTRALREAAQKLAAGDQTARYHVVDNARAYGCLLRDHIMKEDNILFPMAGQVVPVQEHDQVLAGFEHVEHEETGEGVHEKYLALADALEKEANAA